MKTDKRSTVEQIIETLELLPRLLLKIDLLTAIDWLQKPNPHFGNASPISMVVTGRGHKVRLFVERALDDDWGI